MTESNIPSQLFYAYKSAAVFTAAQTVEKHLVCLKMGSLGLPPPTGSRGGRVDYNIKCNTKKYGHHTHFRVKCNYHKTKGTEVEYEVLYTFYTI